MIENSGSLTTGQRQQDASAAVAMSPATLRLIASEWYYDTSQLATDGGLMTQDSTGDMYFAATADLGTVGYTRKSAAIQSMFVTLY